MIFVLDIQALLRAKPLIPGSELCISGIQTHISCLFRDAAMAEHNKHLSFSFMDIVSPVKYAWKFSVWELRRFLSDVMSIYCFYIMMVTGAVVYDLPLNILLKMTSHKL